MKKICVVVLSCVVFFLGAQTKIPLADNEFVLQMGVLHDDTSVILIKEETPGYISLLENNFLLIGNKKIQAMTKGVLHFFNDGADFVYTGYEGEKMYLISGNGGVKKGPYDAIDSIAVSPSTKTVSYSVRIDDKYYVVNGNLRVGPYRAIGDLVFADAGHSLVYSAKINDEWFIVKGEERIGPFFAVGDIVYAEEGDSLAYCVQKKDGWYIIKDEDEGGPFTNVADIAYSPEKKSFAYGVSIGSDWFIVNENETLGPFDTLGTLQFSPDGNSIAYTTCNASGEWYVSINNEKAGPYTELGSSLVFSPDNTTIAYTAKIDDMWYVVNGIEKIGLTHPVDNIRFSNDGTAMAFYVRFGQDTYTKVIIGSQDYTGFIVNGSVIYVDGDVVYRE